MHPFEQHQMGATVPIPMAAMNGLGYMGQTPPQGQQIQLIEPVIDGVSGPMHIALGAVIGLGVGYFVFKK